MKLILYLFGVRNYLALGATAATLAGVESTVGTTGVTGVEPITVLIFVAVAGLLTIL
jgi:hypothetical protein